MAELLKIPVQRRAPLDKGVYPTNASSIPFGGAFFLPLKLKRSRVRLLVCDFAERFKTLAGT